MTTNEYSDLFTALEKLQETLVGISGAGGGIHFIDAQYYAAAVIEAIELLKAQQPTVVRCKDCKYAHLTYEGDCKYCQLDIDRGFTEKTYRNGNWFCADGERREE